MTAMIKAANLIMNAIRSYQPKDIRTPDIKEINESLHEVAALIKELQEIAMGMENLKNVEVQIYNDLIPVFHYKCSALETAFRKLQSKISAIQPVQQPRE